MEQIKITVGEIRKIIQESASEFEPKLGDGVMSDNKKNNDKSYKDAEKAAKDYDGGLKPEKKGKLPDKDDYNRTVLDYNPRTEPTKEYKDKVEAQLQGYTSKMEKENGIEKVGEFDNDGKLGDYFKKSSDKINKEKEKLSRSGIQGKNLDNEEKNTLYENMKPTAKRLYFKHTKFLNEAQMLSRIPEEYKKDGQVIYMKDSQDNEYIVECSKSERTGYIETNVLSYKNDRLMTEQANRIEMLMGYKSEKSHGTINEQVRADESKGFEDIMNLSRGLIK